jgi:aspartyl-tRNA(Asn)/glutamyl-tRNA(Gln) amidotransferase subunit A
VPDDDLVRMTAAETLAAFRERRLSPVETMRATIDRIEAVDPQVNALPVRFFDDALAAARRAEDRYAGRGPRPRPLEGLPVAVKEETPVRGQPCTQGSLIHRDTVATETAECIARVVRAGGIVHARSTAPEFSCMPFTHSRLWGVTRNPWNLDYSPGGSTGGGAAALAAGMTSLATGSDIGGSIRQPASCCGVVGFKPPYGRIPEFAPYNLDHYCHEGPLARTVEDCRLLANVMAGPHSSDPVAIRPKLTIPAGPGSIRGWRIAMSVDLGAYRVDREVAENLRASAEAFRTAGATVTEVDLGWDLHTILTAARAHFAAIFGADIERSVERHRDLMTDYAIARVDDFRAEPPIPYLRALEVEAAMMTSLARVLERHRVLICPTFAIPALTAGDSYIGRGPDIDGAPTTLVREALMTLPFNMCSRSPVLSVPSGRSSSGVPTGMQIVGRSYDDRAVFRAAAAFERERPWIHHRPDLRGGSR